MKVWSDFYNYMLPDLPGCPFIAMDFALRQSAIQFCVQSLAWRYVHQSVPITVDVDEYLYSPPDDALVHAVLYAEFNDVKIDVNTRPDDMLIWNWRHSTGTPQYLLSGPTSFTLVPNPDVEGTLTLTVAVKPDDDSIGIENNDIFTEYKDAIVHGAKARLMLSPKKPYTDAQLAAIHMHEFAVKTTAAGVRAARAFTRAPLQTTMMSRGRNVS
jgi:hypothetical protein